MLQALLAVAATCAGRAHGMSYFENFTAPGEPVGPSGTYWHFTDDIRPVPKGWNDLMSGDGYARLTVDADLGNDKDATYPFQTVSMGPVGPGHLLEMYAEGVAVPGLGGFVFTYNETGGVDEIDIEIVPDDHARNAIRHDILPPAGWTDARFNAWGSSDPVSLLPETSHKQPVKGKEGTPISLIDSCFHVYSIRWLHVPGGDGRSGRVDFFIDGVPQRRITRPVPDGPSDVILGFRRMSWTGPLSWQGTRTMRIDWLNIKPASESSPTAVADEFAIPMNGTLQVRAPGVLSNDSGSGLEALLIDSARHGRVTLHRDGSLDYAPVPGFSGTDRMIYRTTGPDGESNHAVVSVRIANAVGNRKPSAHRAVPPAAKVYDIKGALIRDFPEGLPIIAPGRKPPNPSLGSGEQSRRF
ncbi:MAG TPA: Ig-like domain-containing protein [Fibrobacteria bacterium]|nr:Ig-like domain-containing protein [Fibrobacteria bacterium]